MLLRIPDHHQIVLRVRAQRERSHAGVGLCCMLAYNGNDTFFMLFADYRSRDAQSPLRKINRAPTQAENFRAPQAIKNSQKNWNSNGLILRTGKKRGDFLNGVRFCPLIAYVCRFIRKICNVFFDVPVLDAPLQRGTHHGVVFDELHTQPNRKLFDVMTKGSGDARMQPLYFLITTAGTDTNSICYETHQKAKDILEGRKIDTTFYPVIYGADESDDWTDPRVWRKANPSLDITVGMDKVEAACNSAKQNPGEENSFRQLRLNQWVKQAVRWMPMDKWDACAFAVNEDELEGRVCYGGLDLSSTTDMTAFVLVFPPQDEDDKYIILPYFWVPEDTLDLRVRRDHVPYDLWEKKGYLQTTEGNVVHYGYIEKFIEKLGERFNIREIAFDRWGAVQMVQNLDGMGFTVVPFGQGFKDMSPPTKELMKLVLEKRIAHGGHPVLRWNMDNIFIRTDPAGNIKADKEKSTEKIDGAVATIMALDRAIRCGNDAGESVYDTRGLLVF